MTRILPKNGPPTHPGEILLEEYLEPLGLSQTELAAKMNVPVQRVNQIIKGRRGVSAETAVLLGRVLDTDPWFWMQLQAQYDLWFAQREVEAVAPTLVETLTGYFTDLFGTRASPVEPASATFNVLALLWPPTLRTHAKPPTLFVNESTSVFDVGRQRVIPSGVVNA